MGCGVGRRRGLDPELLWLWLWLAATALIKPLAWEPPYGLGAALEKEKKKKKKVIVWNLGLKGKHPRTSFILHMESEAHRVSDGYFWANHAGLGVNQS